MQEHRRDGTDALTDRPSAERIEQALSDARNAFVALHREGSIVTDHKGRQYAVNSLGQWVRVGKEARDG